MEKVDLSRGCGPGLRGVRVDANTPGPWLALWWSGTIALQGEAQHSRKVCGGGPWNREPVVGGAWCAGWITRPSNIDRPSIHLDCPTAPALLGKVRPKRTSAQLPHLAQAHAQVHWAGYGHWHPDCARPHTMHHVPLHSAHHQSRPLCFCILCPVFS